MSLSNTKSFALFQVGENCETGSIDCVTNASCESGVCVIDGMS